MIAAARVADVTSVLAAHDGQATRSRSARSTKMYQLMHEDLARAHLRERLAEAERERLGLYVLRLARARRRQRRARRHAEQAQLQLRVLAG